MAKNDRSTHKSIKTGKPVIVEKYEGGTLVVTSMTGKVLGSYAITEKKAFYEKYVSTRAKKKD
jgi:hypothetical protein